MGKDGRRVTMTLYGENLEVLNKVAEVIGSTPGEVAKNIVIETLTGMKEMFGMEDGEITVSSNQAVFRMMRVAMAKMSDAIADVQELTK